ncbi:MAG TPA: hypothetical protein VG733_09520 [Chthoniobacteraceae bacterium]|nr:hypothetical protein [Chthoniobacteraceae bacterium]
MGNNKKKQAAETRASALVARFLVADAPNWPVANNPRLKAAPDARRAVQGMWHSNMTQNDCGHDMRVRAVPIFRNSGVNETMTRAASLAGRRERSQGPVRGT